MMMVVVVVADSPNSSISIEQNPSFLPASVVAVMVAVVMPVA